MRTITTTTKIYEYKELEPLAQAQAMHDHADFLASMDWDTEEYIPNYVQDALEANQEGSSELSLSELIAVSSDGAYYIPLELQDYEFLSDGERFNQ